MIYIINDELEYQAYQLKLDVERQQKIKQIAEQNWWKTQINIKNKLEKPNLTEEDIKYLLTELYFQQTQISQKEYNCKSL